MSPKVSRSRRHASGVENANPYSASFSASPYKMRPTPGSPRFIENKNKLRRRQESIKLAKEKSARGRPQSSAGCLSNNSKASTSTTSLSSHPTSPIATSSSAYQSSSSTTTFEDAEMEDFAAEASPKRLGDLNLPRYLERPVLKPVKQKILERIDPEFKDMSLEYFLDGLPQYTERMRKVLQSVDAVPNPEVLDDEIDIIVDADNGGLPTHMLAIHDPSEVGTEDQPKKVTMYPVHNVVLASQCSNLPALPLYPKKGMMLSKTQCHQQLPVVHLGVPHPESFPLVKDFLYTHDTSALVSYMLPLVPSTSSSSDAAATALNPDTDFETKAAAYREWKRDMSDRYADALAKHLEPSVILQHLARVYSVYRNVVALGICDERIWEYLDMCWEILIVAIARANGKEMEIEFGYQD